MFSPYSVKDTPPRVYGIPKIEISQRAYMDMWHLTDIVDTEVGWLTTVDRTEKGGFLIEDVYILDQECHGATTELSPEGISTLTEKLMLEDDAAGIPLDDCRYRANKLLGWFHSHAGMCVSPSGQDDTQMNAFRNRDWFIRGICNKKREMELTLYFFRLGITVKCAPWIVVSEVDDTRRNQIAEEVKIKVKKKGYAYPGTASSGYSSYDWQEDGTRRQQWDRKYNRKQKIRIVR
jgi:proteasome lid subunit RPN8/RPN11